MGFNSAFKGLTEIAILSPKEEDWAKINELMANTLIHSKTYCSVECIDNVDKSDE